MNKRRRVAVLGLYNSGSTVVAGMLHRLGVNLGAPFWAKSSDDDPLKLYEPFDLAWHLRRWWNEPELDCRVSREYRVRFLAAWAALQEAVGPAPIGAKHPLLSMCGADLLAAWGTDARLVWAWRPLNDSIAGLERRGWFEGRGQPLQEALWFELCGLEASHPGIVRLQWDRVRADPVGAARELASVAGVDPSAEELASAASFVRAD